MCSTAAGRYCVVVMVGGRERMGNRQRRVGPEVHGRGLFARPRPAGAGGSRKASLLSRAWPVATAFSLIGAAAVAAQLSWGDGEGPSAGPRFDTANAAEPAPRPAPATVPSTNPSAGASGDAGGAPVVTSSTPVAPEVTTVPPETTTTPPPEPTTTPPASVAPTTDAGPPRSTAEVLPAASCSDPAGDASTEGFGDVDLLAVQLRRDSKGLTVSFLLNGPVQANAATATGAPSTNLWQVLLASGDTVLYAFSLTQQGDSWEAALVDFSSAAGDRLGVLPAASGTIVKAVIPAANLGRLPAAFSWWALTNTDRQPARGAYIGDDCPNGTGDIDAGLALPAEDTRAVYP